MSDVSAKVEKSSLSLLGSVDESSYSILIKLLLLRRFYGLYIVLST